MNDPGNPDIPGRPDPFGVGDPSVQADVPLVAAESPTPTRPARPWIALGAAALVVLVIGGGALALRSFLSTSVAAAEVMPPDTELFVSIDFLQFLEGDARKLNDTIISMVEATGEIDAGDLRDVDGLIGEIDEALQDALGIDFSDDIRPWVGRTVAVSVSGLAGDLSTMDLGYLPDILMVVETRDRDVADQFLVDFATGLERATGVEVVRRTHNEVPLFIAADAAEFDPPLVFARIF